jgi:hypothetical protein
MLKTFTILLTASDKLTVDGIESAVLHGMTAVADGEMRIDAFEGQHIEAGRMNNEQAAALVEVSKNHEFLRRPPEPRTWADLPPEQQAATMRAARDYGGSFARKVAELWNVADAGNAAKIGEAFGAMLIESYGPGSGFYENP